jgi:co-chaperonin GroES (HSP10)
LLLSACQIGENLLVGLVHGVPEVEDASKLPNVKVGDKVLFAKYGASEVRREMKSERRESELAD